MKTPRSIRVIDGVSFCLTSHFLRIVIKPSSLIDKIHVFSCARAIALCFHFMIRLFRSLTDATSREGKKR